LETGRFVLPGVQPNRWKQVLKEKGVGVVGRGVGWFGRGVGVGWGGLSTLLSAVEKGQESEYS